MERVADPLEADAVSPLRQWSEPIAFGVTVVALLIAPVFVYPVFLMKALCFALFACAFNLLIGFVGLLSFGHALFFGWASYVSAYAAKVWGVPPELAIIMLALAQMMYFFALQARFTGGEDGIQAVPRGRLLGLIDLSDPTAMYLTVAAIFLAAFL